MNTDINTLILKEKIRLDQALKGKRGNDLLQIGGIGKVAFAEKASAARIFYLDDHFQNNLLPYIQGKPDSLPIQSESIDIVLLIHTAETADNLKGVLSEAYRVLRPNGQLIITGLNRRSIWQWVCARQKLHSMGKIKKMLWQLDFEMTLHQTFYFCTPWVFTETLGQIFLPYLGAAFMMIATKNKTGVTPLIDFEWQKTVLMRTPKIEPSRMS
jgi:SAM-dependent methyltransferase